MATSCTKPIWRVKFKGLNNNDRVSDYAAFDFVELLGMLSSESYVTILSIEKLGTSVTYHY